MNHAHANWRKSFFTIASGQAVSLIGSAAVQFSLIWWLASETASPLMLSLSALFAFLPQLILGPFVGVWIDRWKRKTVIICADLFTGLAATVFAVMFLFSQPPYWSACVVLGIRAVGNVFHTPAIQAVIPLLVPQEELIRANGWSQFLQSGAFMLGPVLGAAMYAALPLPIILLTDLVGALAASITVAVTKIPELPPSQAQARHFLREMKEGVQALTKDRRLFIVTMAATVGMLCFLPLSSFYPLMTSDYFRASAWHASLVEFLYAAGMLLCAAGASLLGSMEDQLKWVHIGMFGLGLTSLLCGFLPASMWGFWLFALLCFLMGASSNLYNIPYMTYLQRTIPPEAQGRVFSLIGSLMSLAMPLGLVIAGPVAEAYGVPLWFVISGAVFVLAAGCSWALSHRPGFEA